MNCDIKAAYEKYIAASTAKYYWGLGNNCGNKGFIRDEFRLYLDCRESLRRDLYVGIADLEVFLHEKIREIWEMQVNGDHEGDF